MLEHVRVYIIHGGARITLHNSFAFCESSAKHEVEANPFPFPALSQSVKVAIKEQLNNCNLLIFY